MLNATIAIVSLVLGWFLKVLSDRWSERTAFDHRFRLEKEYGLYSDLWDKLFELRRAVGDLVDPLGSTSTVQHGEQFIERFNAYQAVVRKGEPFMSPSVYSPAREIVTLGSQIAGNIGDQKSLPEGAANGARAEAVIEKGIRLEDNNDAAFQKIEELFQEVAGGIRNRVYPQGSEPRKAVKAILGKEGRKDAPPHQ